MSQTDFSNFKYNPDVIGQKEFLDKFVIRTDIFEEIFDDIKNADFTVANQHYIIVGQRGQGKTSLLRRIKIAIEDDSELSSFLLPIKFAEEQYQIRTLCRFFEVIAEYLQEEYESDFDGILDEMEANLEDDDYFQECFDMLENRLKSKGKKLIILSDNIDEVLGKLKDQEQRQLRNILMTSPTIRIIGASTKMFDHQHDYSKPFYEYFKIEKLTGLDYEESIKFLLAIGNEEQKKQISNIIKTNPAKIETLRQLTGGVPRTLVMLFDIFIQEQSDAFGDLLKILNDVTPLYKDRMDNLPDILQDIVHNIAINWDGITTKELAKKTRLESKSASSQLKQLEKYQIIEYEKVGKNKIYKIKERFFNIWYLMRFGRKKDRNRVEWLVQFLLAWYDRKELNQKAENFIDSLVQKNLDENYAYFMSEAFGFTGALDIETEERMKNKTEEHLSKIKSPLKDDISDSDFKLYNQTEELKKNGEIKKALNILLKSKKDSSTILSHIGTLYFNLNDINNAIKYFEKIKNRKDAFSISLLAFLSHLYYINNTHKIEALHLVNKSYNIVKTRKTHKNYFTILNLSIIYLWNDELNQSYMIFEEYLNDNKLLNDSNKLTTNYFKLLISKGQYCKAKEFFEDERYQLKDRYKPVWYALMSYMQDDFPTEFKKMGSELTQSVDEIISEIEVYREKYS